MVGKSGSNIGLLSLEYAGDGKVLLRICKEIISDMSRTALGKDKLRDIAKSSISRLNFNLESSVVSEVNEAKRKFSFLKS